MDRPSTSGGSGDAHSMLLQNRLAEEIEHAERMFHDTYQGLDHFTYNEEFFELDIDKLCRNKYIKLGKNF